MTCYTSQMQTEKQLHNNKQDNEWHKVIQGCIANNRKSQEKIYRHFFPVMERMIRRYTQDDDQVMSIMNNGFLRVFKKVHLYEHKGSFEGWIRRLIYHSLSDYFRSNSKDLKFLVFDDISRERPITANNSLYYEDLIKLVHKLPEKHMKVFQLYAIEGYLHREISEQMNISEGTSKWYLSEARKVLQKSITNNYGKNYTDAG